MGKRLLGRTGPFRPGDRVSPAPPGGGRQAHRPARAVPYLAASLARTRSSTVGETKLETSPPRVATSRTNDEEMNE